MPPKKRKCLRSVLDSKKLISPPRPINVETKKDDESENADSQFLRLNDEILYQIVEYINLYQRIKLEFVSRQFRNSVLRTYRSVKKINLENYVYQFSNDYDGHFKSNQRFKVILKKFKKHFPNLESISGFKVLVDVPSLANLELLAQLPKLKCVSFRHCTLRDADLNKFLLKCPNLIKFDFSHGILLPVVKQSSNPANENHKKILNSGFENLKKLENLDISGLKTENNWEFLDAINSPVLKIVNFTHARAGTARAARFFERFSSLEHVNISSYICTNQISNFFYRAEIFDALALSQCKLKSLMVSGYHRVSAPNHVDDHVIKLMTSSVCSELKELDLRVGFLPIDRLINEIVGNLPNLEKLHLSIENASVDCLKKLNFLTNLKLLQLEDFIPRKFSKNVISNWSNLSNLDTFIFTKVQLEFDELNFLAQFSSLHSLDLSWVKINNEYFMKICQIMGPRLQALHVFSGYQHDIKSSGAVVMADNCPNLHILRMIQVNIKAVAIRKMADKCRKLEKLKITSEKMTLKDVSSENLLYLIGNCNNLKILSMETCFLKRLWAMKRFHREFKDRVTLIHTFEAF